MTTVFTKKTAAARMAFGVIAALAMAFLLSMYANHAAAAAKSIEVTYNDEVMKFDRHPVNVKGTTLVPFRPLFEKMGMTVKWDSKQKTVTGTKAGLTIVLQIDSRQASVNQKSIPLTQPPQLVQGSTMVPLRFISETTGAVVGWNPYKPQALIYSEEYLQQQGLTKAQAVAAINKELERIKSEIAAAQAEIDQQPVPVPQAPKGSGEYKPAGAAVDLTKLQGMYYGFRPDYDGSECGGMCWDLYTFISGNKIVVGAPLRGGPETIDCKKDKCLTYTVKSGKLSLSNGEAYSIAKKNGKLFIDDVELTPVSAVSSSLKLSKSYIYRGFFGLNGISSGSTSWSTTITFTPKGNFKSDSLMLGSVRGGNGGTQGSTAGDTGGSYRISGNTITLAHRDGKVEHLLFFIQDSPSLLNDLQIGENNFILKS